MGLFNGQNIWTRVTTLLHDKHLRQNRKVRRVIAVGWVLLSVALVLWFTGQLNSNWQRLLAYRFDWQPAYFGWALASYLVVQAILIINWRSILQSLGGRTTWPHDISSYSYSFFMSGLPGGFWNIFSLFYFYEPQGLGKPLVLLAVTLEQASLLLSALLVGILIAPFTLQLALGSWIYSGVALGIALLALLSSPRAWVWLLKRLGRLGPLALLAQVEVRATHIRRWTCYQLGTNLVSGLLVYALINVVLPLPPSYLPVIMASWMLSIVASSLLYWLPGTSGFSIGLSLLTFGSFLPIPVVLALLLMLRLTRIVGGSLWVLASFLCIDLPRLIRQRNELPRALDRASIPADYPSEDSCSS